MAITGLFFKAGTGETKRVDLDGLESYYKLIGCRCIDIIRRKIGNRYYEIICDDEGLMVDQPIISSVNRRGEIMTVGNIIITGKADYEGNLTGLTDNEINYIQRQIMHLRTRRDPDGYRILTGVWY